MLLLSRSLLSRSLLAASLARLPIRAAHTMSVSISSAFDGGNIEFVGQDAQVVQLRIRPDPYTELEKKQHMQWFAFRATLDHAADITYEIGNADKASYPNAWPGSQVVASTDRKNWQRVSSTRYDKESGKLSWEWTHTGTTVDRSVFFAYFDLYSYERHLDLVARCATASNAPNLKVGSLGQTLDGREIDVISVGTGSLQAWVIHRQHPGESQAAFYAEGLLVRLLGLDSQGVVDGLVSKLLLDYTFHVVPCMNPDGAVRGYLRVNAAGANLNREWANTGEYVAPTIERSPEVFHTLAAMERTGVDAFVDVHGDEGLPFTFFSGSEGLNVWGTRLERLHGAFMGAYSRANPDMQPKFGYAATPKGEANLAICSNLVGERFNCLAGTLEMPFKDNAGNPAALSSFNGHRCARLGASLLDALSYVAPQLRGVEEPTFALPDDVYVLPVEEKAEVDAFLAANPKKMACRQ